MIEVAIAAFEAMRQAERFSLGRQSRKTSPRRQRTEGDGTRGSSSGALRSPAPSQ
jgi:hypothetical protein